MERTLPEKAFATVKTLEKARLLDMEWNILHQLQVFEAVNITFSSLEKSSKTIQMYFLYKTRQ